MKKVAVKEIYEYIVERYDLCEVYSKSKENRGLIICYLLAVCNDCELESMELEAKHEESGVPLRWHIKYSKETFVGLFKFLDSFLNKFDDDDFGYWRLTVIRDSIELSISGERKSTEIGISYKKEKPVNLLPLLSSVETASYKVVKATEK